MGEEGGELVGRTEEGGTRRPVRLSISSDAWGSEGNGSERLWTNKRSAKRSACTGLIGWGKRLRTTAKQGKNHPQARHLSLSNELFFFLIAAEGAIAYWQPRVNWRFIPH